MTAYLRRSALSVGGLSLSLENEQGQAQDVEYVVWTVSSAHDGRRVSGQRMKAVRKGVGRYYAPWYADDPTGAYEVAWEWRRDPVSAVEQKIERFFVMDLDEPTCKCGHVKGLPPPGGHVFEPGVRISGQEMTLRLVSSSGTPRDATSITWSIECQTGQTLVPDTPAQRLSAGVYGIDWVVSVCGGLYFVRWKWSEFPGDPLATLADPFQVVNPVNPRYGVNSVGL